VLKDPYDVFDLAVFRDDPSIFWRFAHLVFPPESPEYSVTHDFLAALEQRGKLLRVYSQNVDTLERGITPEHLRCVHGSWRQNHCLKCNQTYTIEDLRAAVSAGTVPFCARCGGPIKPGIVFFGQPTELDNRELDEDARRADLLIVVGTSLNVQPIADLPRIMRNVPSILINREPVACRFDAEMLGNCSDVVQSIQVALGWKEGDMAESVRLGRNRFVFPSGSSLGTEVVDAGRSRFLRTPARRDARDLD
jgi:NAD-dependent SIR2 family protein deacetylase